MSSTPSFNDLWVRISVITPILSADGVRQAFVELFRGRAWVAVAPVARESRKNRTCAVNHKHSDRIRLCAAPRSSLSVRANAQRK